MNEMNMRFKELRKSLKMSQEAFGEWLGITKSGISDIESGRRNVTNQHIVALKIHGVNEEWIRTGEGEPFKPSPKNAVQEFAMKLGIDAQGTALLESIAYMTPEERKIIISFMRKVLENLDAISARVDPAAVDPAEEAADYLRELELQKEAADTSSASDGTDGIKKDA